MKRNKLCILKKNYLIIYTLLLIFSGCQETEKPKVNTDTLNKEKSSPEYIKQTLFKGMCSGIETFSECGSDKKFKISPEGEIKELEKAIAFFSPKKPDQQFYIEVEGFSSTREKPGEGFDSMLVITQFLKLDVAMTCQ